MTWDYYNEENILKADFSFRDVIQNSRGIYARIFNRIELTPDLSKYGGALLAKTIRALDDVDLSVAQKRKSAEIVLAEPLLIGIDMMNDPKYDDKIRDLAQSTITTLSDEETNEITEDDIPEEVVKALGELGLKLAKEIVNSMEKEIEKELKKVIESSDVGDGGLEGLSDKLWKVAESEEFLGYTVVVISAVIKKMLLEATERSIETESNLEVELNPDEDFPQSFYDKEETMKSWFNNVKR